MSNDSCKVPEVKPITIKRFGTSGLVPTIPTVLDCNLWQKTDLKDGEFAINTVDKKLYIRSDNQILELTNQSSGGGNGTVTSVGLSVPSAFTVANSPITSAGTLAVTGAGNTSQYIRGDGSLATFPSIPSGTVTSVGLTMPSAFSVTNSPVTTSGTISVTGAGLVSQYVRGDGTLANFPNSTGGGSSINYYLNGSISQGTISGVTYYEMNRTPILGLGTNFTLTNTNNYIASFLTDAGDPNQLNIPAGNWNCELYFNVSNNSGTPSFYIELYKYDGVTFTLIASSSTNPEFITNGTQVDLYTTAIPVPQTTLLATDRLAVRVHVNTSGNRTVTLHTEDNNLCQIITTFSTGLTALNGLIAQVQNFATGTSGTDFAINSVTNTHTFNLPTASAANRGALSSADWTIFNNKVPTGLITSSGLTMNTARLLGRGTAGVGAVEEIVIGSGLTLTGTTLSAAGGSGITIGTTAITSGTVNRILFEGAGNVVQQDATFVWNNTDKRLILGTEIVASTNSRCVIIGKAAGTNQTFAIHNNSGTNNSLVVLDNGFVGLGISTPTATDFGGTGTQISEIRKDQNDITKLLILNSNNNSAAASGIKLVAGGTAFNSTNTQADIVATPSTWSSPLNSRLWQLVTGNINGALIDIRSNSVSYPTYDIYIRNGVVGALAAGGRILSVTNGIGDNATSGAGLILGNSTLGTGAAVNLSFQSSNQSNTTTTNILYAGSTSSTQWFRGLLQIQNVVPLQTGTGAFGGIMLNSHTNTAISFGNETTPSGQLIGLNIIGNSVVTGGITINASAQLEIVSTTKGFLPPRMTNAQRIAIVSPAVGLIVYCTDVVEGLYLNKSTGWTFII